MAAIIWEVWSTGVRLGLNFGVYVGFALGICTGLLLHKVKVWIKW